MNTTNHKIINGDIRNMPIIDDESVQLILTSPPYWQLKDYGHNNQIGYNDIYEKYINNKKNIFNYNFFIKNLFYKKIYNLNNFNEKKRIHHTIFFNFYNFYF
ncbi:MAG: hypothetical protein B6I24_02525 [Bacteroidetes bacterium 4572_128]|nr:MAG: hypothetical protein B6I24_02525 [Bacteroidetes bacterium 4572_128]